MTKNGGSGIIDIRCANSERGGPMREKQILIRVNDNEKALIESAAESQGLASASWARLEILRAARQQHVRERVSVEYGAAPEPGLLSLFCGPGGLDEGFKKAGFHTTLAIDNDTECINTFRQNHSESRAAIFDIRELTLDIVDTIAGREVRPVGVIGGPPCQSFSVSNIHQREDDPRLELSTAYATLLGKLNRRHPISFFLFENVPGLLGKKHAERYGRFKDQFRDAGFALDEWKLNAKDYGVPQERPRLFIVGINRNLHPEIRLSIPKPEGKTPTVRDTIYGLPDPVYNAPGLDPDTFPVHPNHWCLVPRSKKFENGNLSEGQMIGRSFRTLAWDKPSWTVAYGHREVHVHPSGRRRLSIYEAMLIQSFPKRYRLTGNMSAQIRLISEAVPPRLGWHIAKTLRSGLGL